MLHLEYFKKRKGAITINSFHSTIDHMMGCNIINLARSCCWSKHSVCNMSVILNEKSREKKKKALKLLLVEKCFEYSWLRVFSLIIHEMHRKLQLWFLGSHPTSQHPFQILSWSHEDNRSIIARELACF